MTQSSIAVTGNNRDWTIINASPDIRAQLAATLALHPTGPRAVALASVLITNGDIDHVAGLLTLREKQPFTLFATARILEVLAANPIFAALDPALVARQAVDLDRPFTPAPSIEARLFAVPGKVPLYLEEGEVQTDVEGEGTVGVELASEDRRAYYIPGCARMTPALSERLRGAALVLFDGTLWSDTEMIEAGLGHKTGRRMGHMPVSGPDGALEAFRHLRVERKVFVHLNNTNPLVDAASPEAALAAEAGWTVARDGLELVP